MVHAIGELIVEAGRRIEQIYLVLAVAFSMIGWASVLSTALFGAWRWAGSIHMKTLRLPSRRRSPKTR